jgi:hypothetical protein
MQQIIGSVLVAAAIVGGVFYATSQWSAVKQQELKNMARYQCALSSKYETTDPAGATVSYPVEELYNKCLSDMGVE